MCVLNVPSGHIKTCAAVRGSTTLYYEQAYKDFLIFSQSHKTDPGLMRFASRKAVNHPSLGNHFTPLEVRKFLVFCVWIWLKKDFQITIFNGLLFVWQHWQKPRYIPLCPYLLPYTFEKIFCVINLAIYEKFHVIQCSSWKFWKVIRLNINDTAH